MTVHAYRDGVLACDSWAWDGELHAGLQVKSGRIGGMFWGQTGQVAYLQAFKDWLRRGAFGLPPQPSCNSSAFIIMPDDLIVNFDQHGPEVLTGLPFYACGAGAQIALGAMQAGATATQAVAAACRWMPGACGGDIRVLWRPATFPLSESR